MINKNYKRHYYSIINKNKLEESQTVLLHSDQLENQYFGLSPFINETCIQNLLNDGILTDANQFENFLNTRLKYFTLPQDHSYFDTHDYNKTIMALLARAIVCASFNFSLIKLDAKELIIDETQVGMINTKFNNKYKFNIRQIDNKYYIIGFVSKELQEYLLSTFEIKCNNFYTHHNNVGNHSYYSGSIPRLNKLCVHDDNVTKNRKIWDFYITKTSYFTINSFENTKFNEYFLLDKYKQSLVEFDQYNAQLMDQYHKDIELSTNHEDIDMLNKYLEASLHTNNIGVTGNLITQDNLLIITKRSKTAIHKNQIYPSVNGNAEILDENVDFYKHSNYEDLPSIDLTSTFSKSFDKELTRETIAELNTINFSKKWKFIGISVLYETAIRNKFQFNIIATTNSYSKYAEIFSLQSKATEAFENSQLYGINIVIYKNWLNWMWQLFHKGITNIKAIISTMVSCFSIAMLIYTSITSYAMNVDDIVKITSFSLLSFLSVYAILYNLKSTWKIRRTKVSLYIKTTSDLDKIESTFQKCKAFRQANFNAVTLNAITNHFYMMICNNNSPYWNI